MKTPGVKYCTSVVGYSMLSGCTEHLQRLLWITLENGPSGRSRKKNMTLDHGPLRIARHAARFTEGVRFAFSPRLSPASVLPAG